MFILVWTMPKEINIYINSVSLRVWNKWKYKNKKGFCNFHYFIAESLTRLEYWKLFIIDSKRQIYSFKFYYKIYKGDLHFSWKSYRLTLIF